MAENKVVVNVPADYSGTPIVVELLEGVAENAVNKTPFEITGTITAPLAYLKGQAVAKENTVVVINIEAGTITAFINNNNELKSKVMGRFEVSKLIKDFAINMDKRFSLDEFRKLVRLNGPWFADEAEHKNLLLKISGFSAKINREFTDKKDNKGNKEDFLRQQVETDIPFSFCLKAEIYKGSQMFKYNVDVCLDATDAGVRFWMESSELIKLSAEQNTSTLVNEGKEIEGLGYTVIYQ